MFLMLVSFMIFFVNAMYLLQFEGVFFFVEIGVCNISLLVNLVLIIVNRYSIGLTLYLQSSTIKRKFLYS